MDPPSSKIQFQYAGLYNLQFSVQLENANVADQDVNIWLRINGTDVAGSNGRVSIASKHGGVNGHSITGWNFVLRVGAGQYVEIIWSPSSADVTIPHYAATVGPPAIPATYSVVLTVTPIVLL